MLRCLDNTVGLARFAGPGHWNDLDMLEVGCWAVQLFLAVVLQLNSDAQVGVGMTWPEQRSHFALWCLLKSPLLISADLRVIAPEVAPTLRCFDRCAAAAECALCAAGAEHLVR